MVKPTILVACPLCQAKGGVQTFTDEEWALAYYAPSMPFRWADSSRVILLEDLTKPTAEDWQAWEDFRAGRQAEVVGLKLTKNEPYVSGLKLTKTERGQADGEAL